MLAFQVCRSSGTAIILLFVFSRFPCLQGQAQAPSHYEASSRIAHKHPLPQWYGDAKLGIIHLGSLFRSWGLGAAHHPEMTSPRRYTSHTPL